MESCPRKESAEQERVPVLLLKLNDTAPQRKTVIILLHNSYKCKEWLCPLLQALNSSWRSGKTIPFIFTRYHTLLPLVKIIIFIILKLCCSICPSNIVFNKWIVMYSKNMRPKICKMFL
ncbi:hypothetical protein VPH35_109973 [Triticum aestivum]